MSTTIPSTTVPIASNAADAEAARQVEDHHAQMAGRLGLLAGALLAAAREGGDGEGARRELLHWLREDLVPHATAEERTLYPAAAQLTEGRLLVEAMLEEHQLIHRLVGELESTTEPVTAASVAASLETVFVSHLAKENDQLVPVLVSSPEHSVADMLAGMHELLGGHEAHGAHEHAGSAEGHAGHACACGEPDPAGHPELDARVVPHAIRHATIFGALDGVRPGAGLVLVAPHDPLPLLGQVEQRDPGAFEVRYLERGPDAWRLEFLRRA